MSAEDKIKKFYYALEDKFRGSRELILVRLEGYRPFIDALKTITPRPTAYDIGCGRGEWLELLDAAGFDCFGMDLDIGMLGDALSRKLNVRQGDGIAYLTELPTNSVNLISAFHVVEHISQQDLHLLISEAHRVLAPGGLLILETPNPENIIVSTHDFYYDPTHRNPIPAHLLAFYAEYYGFLFNKILRLNGEPTLVDQKVINLRNVIRGASPDYSIVSIKPAPDTVVDAFKDALNRQYGIGLDYLIERFGGHLLDSEKEVASLSQEIARLRKDVPIFRQSVDLTVSNLRDEVFQLTNAFDRIATNSGRIADLIDEVDALRREIAFLRKQHDRKASIRFGAYRHNIGHFFRSISSKDGHAYWKDLRRNARLRARRRAERLKGRRSFLQRQWRSIQKRVYMLEFVYKAITCGIGNPAPVVESVPQVSPRVPLQGLTPAQRLAFFRLKTLVNGKEALAPTLSGGKPRLAYVSPLPPDRTGVAFYSVELIEALSEHYLIDAVVIGDAKQHPAPIGCRSIIGIGEFEQRAGQYDRVLYHIGNSTFHHDMFPLIEKVPGIVVLHDLFLGDLLHFLEANGWPGFWLNQLAHSHGYEALRCRLTRSVSDVIVKYPASFFLFAQAQGVILHSESARDMAAEFYPNFPKERVKIVPHLRKALELPPKANARLRLSIDEDEFVLCSFGFLSPAKCNFRLLDAWMRLGWHKDMKARLVFVGEFSDPSYRSLILSTIESAKATNVHVTGFVDAPQYLDYLAAADLAAQLRADSRGESSGTVADVMGAGLPIIINMCGAMTELPSSCVIKLTDTFSDDELMKALRALRDDPVRRGQLSRLAQNYVKETLAPDVVARRFHAQIEVLAATSSKLSDIAFLREAAIELRDAAPGDEIAIVAKAQEIACGNPLPRPTKELFVDISAMVRTNLHTGIQRVVRAQLNGLMNAAPPGYSVEPVYLAEHEGRWVLRYARHYACKLFGLPPCDLTEDIVEGTAGDIYYMPDFFNDGVCKAEQQGVYRDLRNRGVFISFVVYDNLPISDPKFFPPGTDIVHGKWLRAICESSDQLVCISHAVEAQTVSWMQANANSLKHRPQTCVLHLGADLASSVPTVGIPQNAHTVLHRLRAVPSFLMVGTIEPRKGHLQTIAAFDLLWRQNIEVNLVIVGSEGWKSLPTELRRTIPEIVRRLQVHPNLNRKLFWLDNASDEYLENIYNASTCLIAGSEGEGFGLPLIEAAQHHLPIIARDIPVFREVAGSGAFYFSGDEPEELADSIREWLKLYEADEHPTPENLRWTSWAENVEQLKLLLTRTPDCAPSRMSSADADELLML